jgi:uncharacterized membrane protein
MSMPRLTVLLALVLIATGVGFYLGTGRESATALIPAFLGVPIGICGIVAHREGARKIAMHLALVFAVVGIAGTARGVLGLANHLGGEASDRPAALWAQTIVALLLLIFLILGVRSFIAARRSRAD